MTHLAVGMLLNLPSKLLTGCSGLASETLQRNCPLLQLFSLPGQPLNKTVMKLGNPFYCRQSRFLFFLEGGSPHLHDSNFCSYDIY